MNRPSSKDAEVIRIWQWNCRGYRQKRANLQMHTQSQDTSPEVIALQETGTMVKLPGYKAFQSSNDPKTAVLIQRNIPAERIQFDSVDIPHDLVALYPPKRTGTRLYILNVYSSPKAHGHNFNHLFSLTKKEIGHHALIIVGDFNAPHTAWGYSHCTKKGRLLWDQVQSHRLTLETDPLTPTRVGNSVQRDSTPDLTFTFNIRNAHWHCTDNSLGSDHYLIQLDLTLIPSMKPCPRQSYITDWDDFRQIREQATALSPTVSEGSLQDWVHNILSDARSATKAIDPDLPSDTADSRLQHMWAAYKSIQHRWRKNKRNRKLRRKLADLETAIQEHAIRLSCDQWNQVCDQMHGNLSMKRTWSLLKHLLDPSRSKTEQNNRLTSIVHNFPGTNEELIDKLSFLYIPTGANYPLPPYKGPKNVDLDADITEAEVRGALLRLRPGSAPGPDGVTNKMLRNLDDNSISTLTAYFNYFWQRGSLPSSWKYAKITLIPKPGKPMSIEHLRPISLTSCMGKVLEHILLSRLTSHLNSSCALPHSMIGFRPGLSTQDILLQLSREIITPPHALDTAAILALDLTKAFDRVSHTAILQGLASINPGERMYNYIRDFLTDRKAFIQIGDVTSNIIPLSSIGTPQGAVLSPLLFNLAIINIPRKLEQIPHLKFSLYADDITLWVAGGSDALIEEILQLGAQTVADEAKLAGLTCSPTKSELLLMSPKRGTKTPPNIRISIDNHPIPEVHTLKILGLLIQQNRANTQFLTQLSKHVTQTIGLIRRIATRRQGLRENERIRLIQAFVVSRITYSLPYLHVSATELEKINCLIRKAYKAALQLPLHTSTARFEHLGVHNTAEELVEAHLSAQIARLATTPTGLHILERVGLNIPAGLDRKVSIPHTTHAQLIVRPLPRNMHPTYNAGRRTQRARALERRLPIRQDIHYVDAAEYRHHDAYAIAVINRPDTPPINSLTVNTPHPGEAEEAAIALALSHRPTPAIIISDSQTAVRNFARGLISPLALKILAQNSPTSPVELIWTPAHAGLGGNEAAHAVARGLTIRAGPSLVPYHGARSARDRLTTYHDIVSHYRLARRKYPPAHSQLTHAQERTWRLLQTHTLPCRAVLHHIHPSLYPSPNCPACGTRSTVPHSMWGCPKDPFPLISSDEQWEGALGSSDLGTQLSLVDRATLVAARLEPAATPTP